jgi:hypothetical protein
MKAIPQAPRGFWARLRPAFALPLLGLLILVSYQSFVVFPRLRHSAQLAARPQLLPALSLINVGARGENNATLLARKGEPFLLFVDIPADTRFLNYTASLQDAAGREVWSLSIPESATKDTLSIRVPGRETGGRYSLIVRGENASQATEVGRYPFVLQLQN